MVNVASESNDVLGKLSDLKRRFDHRVTASTTRVMYLSRHIDFERRGDCDEES